MKKVTVIINPVFDETEKSGKFLKFSVIMPDKYSDGDLERKIFNKIRYTVQDEEEL
jgi:hypothetical protein